MKSLNLKVWPWRRTAQLLALLTMLALPVLARYSHYLSARQLDKLADRWSGTTQGRLLAAADAAIRVGIPDGEGGVETRRPRTAILERTREFYGSPWSARLFGVTMTDPLAVVECVAASKAAPWVLVLGLLVPLIGTALLGRVYCGWICPAGLLFDAGAKIRTGLRKGLELKPMNARIPPRTKYVLLGAGLLATLLTGTAVLHYIYPPAMFGREANGFVGAMFDRAESGKPGWAWAGLTGASVLLGILLVVEILVAPGLWCKALCPGGALYSLIGRFRLLRVKRKEAACTDCVVCDRACPRGLLPMTDRTGMECDNCGVCIDVCPTRALGFRLALTDKPIKKSVVMLLCGVLVFAGAPQAFAHHILGIPHYAYDESYPQAPVMKLLAEVGPWEFQLTGYPGNPTPGEPTQINVYAVDKASREPIRRPLTIAVHRQTMTGDRELVYGPKDGVREDALHKFYPTYPQEGNYEITVAFDEAGDTSTLRFPIVVGEPGSPWATLGAYLGGFLLFVLVIRAIRIKLDRRRRVAEAKAQ